ncbi:hypothetical protein D3C72_247130 [compost metagenome]
MNNFIKAAGKVSELGMTYDEVDTALRVFGVTTKCYGPVMADINPLTINEIMEEIKQNEQRVTR